MDKSVNPKNYDGLIIPGGGDINPTKYKAKNKGSYGISNSLDSLQFAVLDKFVKAKKPVLGICRGHQLINVYFGGTLYQNICKHKNGRWISASLCKGSSFVSSAYGKTVPRVLCFHHQAVKKLGKDLKITLKAKDGTVEGIEHSTLPVYGVQFHPERMGKSGTPILKMFISVCKENKNKAH